MYGFFVPEMGNASDKYGYVNEYEVRFSAGITLLLGVYSLVSILFLGEFDIPMIILGMLWLDFLIKVFSGPKFSFFGGLVRPFVKKIQWVGAVQKRFAWSIGLFLSTFAFLCTLLVSGFLPSLGIGSEIYAMVQTIPKIAGLAVPITPPLVACFLCIVFMTLESVFGYCVGCKIYVWMVKLGVFKKIPNQICVNGVCER